LLAAPENEGAFGDAELLGDAGEADAFGAQLDELLNRFLIFHYSLSMSGHSATVLGIAAAIADGHC
jgi:hypothetical protein